MSSCRAEVTPTMVRIRPQTTERSIAVQMLRRTRCVSRAPKCCATMTLAPDESATKALTSRLEIRADEPPTEASAALPSARPTMTASAVL